MELLGIQPTWNSEQGRIDRIGSLSSRKIKTQVDISRIETENKVHVFYPYLSDTLEVNQVHKVFKKMNEFIETFYTGFSQIVEKDNTAATDDIITSLPQQKTERLVSLFDYDKFELNQETANSLYKVDYLGLPKSAIKAKLDEIRNNIIIDEAFYLSPQINEEKQEIIGTFKLRSLQNRRGPFRINIIRHPEDSSKIAIKINAYVCKILDDDATLQKEIIRRIKQRGYQL